MSIEYITKNRAKLVVSLGYKNGKHIRKTKNITYKGKKDAERQYRLFEIECKRKTENITVYDLSSMYYNHLKSKGLKETTLKGYRSIISSINSEFSDKLVSDLTPYDIDKYVENLVKKNSPKTIRNTVSFLSSMLDKGIRWGMNDNNPCRGVEIPKEKGNIRTSLRLEEIQHYLDCVNSYDNLDYTVAVKLALFCGLRRSEIMGLTIDNIDLQKAQIRIEKSRHMVNGLSVVAEPKTKSSKRTLALPLTVKEDIERLIDQHESQAKKLGIQPGQYLICNEFLEPQHPQNVTRFVQRCINEHNLPPVTLHGLRHTYTSLVFHFGYDIAEVSAQLGHSNKSTTLNIYTHLMEDATVASRKISDSVDIFAK